MTTTPLQPTRPATNSSRTISTSTQGSTLADILERVLDKGIVIAGDISVSIASTELLHIRIRLLISSVDKAREMGINWWENDPYLSSRSQDLIAENQQLHQRLESLETQLRMLTAAKEQETVTLSAHTENEVSSPIEADSQLEA
ncbi:gas vesicle protein [Aliinostoc sp. HNIBRCY26]|uniref:gas vesicle protein n=1 Tax=Nostocales TaxID=1161 RepID=UPI000CA2B81D|nr:gas vesicle protein [Nostoc sp. CENA543]AUS99992.1 gas vesicle protein [Nostoc sp. CENA543]